MVERLSNFVKRVRVFADNIEFLNTNIALVLKNRDDDEAERARRIASRNQLAMFLAAGSALTRSLNSAEIESWEQATVAYLASFEPSFLARFQNPSIDTQSSRTSVVTEARINARVNLLSQFIDEMFN
jgi:hypothetical protein